jgi:hypothetical protein
MFILTSHHLLHACQRNNALTLHDKNIHLILVTLSNSALVTRPALEARSAETSLPVLRIAYADSTIFYIRETSAILAYLERSIQRGGGTSTCRARRVEPAY